MTGVEIVLLLTGVVFMVGSFFVAEKLSSAELGKIAELSSDELGKMVDTELAQAEGKIEETIENQLDISVQKIDRMLEKETNEKIMAISEYSDTVFENMNNTHNEIIFLYNMLNDKHVKLTELASDLRKLEVDVRNVREMEYGQPGEEDGRATEDGVGEAVVLKQEPIQLSENDGMENHNQQILALHEQGVEDVEIARMLGRGLGEVKLVIGLYRGDKNS